MNGMWALGVDLGGTKLEVARVDEGGTIRDSMRRATDVAGGPQAIENDIAAMAEALRERAGTPAVGVGVGMAGQIDGKTGVVHFSPNLGWHEVPLLADLRRLLDLPTAVTNDVRAITWGEWVHGAGQGQSDIVCLYVGTGIGGGIVSEGRLLAGCSNTAGELGHITIAMDGPLCTCGNTGCMEAIAGGWAIARQAQQMVRDDPDGGNSLLTLAGGSLEAITAETVARSASAGDRLALGLFKKVGDALSAGSVSIVNAFNPCRLILGGGVIDGVPELIDRIREGVRARALPVASAGIEIVPGVLGSSAGVIGAASLAMRTFAGSM